MITVKPRSALRDYLDRHHPPQLHGDVDTIPKLHALHAEAVREYERLEEQLEAERLRADQNAHLSEVKHERMRELEEQLEAAERLLLAHRQEYVDVYLELSTRDHMNEDEEDARRSLAAFETQAFYPASEPD